MPTLNLTNNQEIKKSVAAWLISTESKRVLLQKRATFDGGNPQSFRGICQPTWNGKLEGGEQVMDALKREAEEELGKKFAEAFDFSALKEFDSGEYSFNGKNFISYNFWGVVGPEELALVKLHSGAHPEFVLVSSSDMHTVKNNSDKSADPEKDVVFFEDQYEALKKLFSLQEVIELFSSK